MKTARLLACCSLWSLILALPSAQAIAAADGWGASYSFNAVAPADNHLVYSKTTIVPGRLPPITSTTGPLFLWPGLSNSKGDLIQTTLDAWQDNKGACGAAPGQWCVEASVFGTCGQCGGPSAAVDPDDHITIEYKLESDNNTWTQTVTSQKQGKVVSTYSRASGPMLGNGFGFATEADADSYTIDTQYYLCTEFQLLKADPNWGPGSGGGNGAQYGATGTGSGPGTAKNVHTPDGGKTWLVDLITLPAMNPQGTQTPPPAYDCSGSTGSGGSTGGGGNSGNGGSTGSGGITRSDGSVSSGGSTGGGGSTRVDGSAGSGGITRSDGSVSSGSSGGAAVGAGTTGTNGGAVGSGGSVATGSGGATGAGGLKGTGGANQGSGGSVVAGSGGTSGGAGTGGATATHATGGSAGTAAGSSGCGCVVGSRSPHGGMSAFLLLGALALLAKRRRHCM